METMNASPWHRDRNLSLDYYLMLPHLSEARVLMVTDAHGWTLPRFTPEVTDFRKVQHINAYVRAQYGLKSAVQRCVTHRYDPDRSLQYRVYALENLSPEPHTAEAGQWVSAEELGRMQIAVPEHREIIRGWLQQAGAQAMPELRAPWARAGWFNEASEWIQAQLDQLNIGVLGPLVQERTWSISCIMRTETTAGEVYFKAVPPFMSQEAVAMRELSRQHPELVPPLLATDAERGWILMPSFGSDGLLETPGISRWEEALNRFARMQVVQADHVNDWLALGVPDRSFNRMVQLIDPLIAMSTQLFSGRPRGLSDGDAEGLHTISMRLKLLCANVAGYGVPHTLVHGDLGGNILVQGGRYIFFDWTDVCITHPFFEMTTVFDTAFEQSGIEDRTEIRTRLRDAYLEPWTRYEPMERLVHAFELSASLGALHQAMTYMWILMNIAEDARWELDGGLILWLRNLLRVLPPGN